MLDKLIQGAIGELNLDQNQVEGGLGLLLNTAKDKLSEGDFSQVTQAFGGDISSLLGAAPASSGGGLGSSLLGMAASALGGGSSLGALASLAGGFKSLNMDMDTVMKFVPLVLNFVQESGGDTVKALLEKALK